MLNLNYEQVIAACAKAKANKEMLPEAVDFYSLGCPGLILCPYKGQMKQSESGGDRRVDQVIATFTPLVNVKMGEGKLLRIGHWQTTHPEAVLWMIERCRNGGDICMSEKFAEVATPMDQKLDTERARTIEVRNQLASYMERTTAQAKEIDAQKSEIDALKKQVATTAAARGNQRPANAEAQT